MNAIQIAYFKHFLFDKGVAKTYIYMYRKSRIKGSPKGDKDGNPESLEQFLLEQPFFRVIMHAFYFPMNSSFGYEYWDAINKQWKKYWEMNEDNFSNESYANLKGTFSILKQNWDSSKYWQVESEEETYKRMGIEPPPDRNKMAGPLPKKSPVFSEGDILQSTLSGEFRKVAAIGKSYYLMDDDSVIDFDKESYWTLVEPDFEKMEATEEPQSEAEEDFEEEEDGEVNNNASGLIERGKKVYEDASINEDYEEKPDFSGVPEYDDELEFFNLNSGSRSKSTRLKENEASLNFRKGFKLTFNQIISKRIKDNKYKYVRLAKNKQGDIVLQLHKAYDSPNPVSISFTSNSVNTVINSKDLCEKLRVLLNVSSDYSILKVRSLFESYEKANFIICK